MADHATLMLLLLVRPTKPGQRSVKDAANGRLKEVYEPVDDNGKERNPAFNHIPPFPGRPWIWISSI